MDNHQIKEGKSYINVTLALQSQKINYTKFLVLRQLLYLQKTCTVEFPMSPKTVNYRCFTYVNMSYNVYKDIKLNDVAYKSEPINIDNAKVKPKTRSQQ